MGNYNSIAVDSLGRPHISYLYLSSDLWVEKLKYASFDGASWTTTVVDDSLLVGEYTSLSLYSSGRPRISYSDGQNFALKYASFDGSAWNKTTVEPGGVGIYISLALDSNGYPQKVKEKGQVLNLDILIEGIENITGSGLMIDIWNPDSAFTLL